MSGATVVWVHADALGASNPALLAHPGAPALFVFDDVVLDGYGLGIKRLVFIYECLLDLPVEIRRGDPVQELVAFARRHGATRIATTWTPAPRFHHLCVRIHSELPVEIIRPEPFVDLAEPVDLARFSRYWAKAEKKLIPQTRGRDNTGTLTLPGFDE